MSFINGFRIVEFIRKDAELKKIPIFLSTSSVDSDMLKMVEDSGANGCLKKPLTNAEALAPLVAFLKAKK